MGSFTISAPNGLTSLQVGGTVISAADLANAGTVPVAVSGESFGALVITGFNAGTGVVSYSYDPTGTSADHSGATNDTLGESLSLVVTDTAGTTATGSLDIGVTDTAPVAVADSRTVSEDETGIVGNVITGVNASADTLGADASSVTGVQAGVATGEIGAGVGSGIVGTYGTLTIGADGSYSYVTNAAAQALNDGESETDTFSYTLRDSDGDSSTVTVSLTVTGANDEPVISSVSSAVVSEEGLSTGIADTIGNPSDTTNNTVFNGTYTATDIDNSSLTATFSGSVPTLTSGGQAVTFVLSNGGQTLTGSAAGNDVIRFDIDNNGGYRTTLLGALDHPNAATTADDGENLLNFNVGIRVSDGTASTDSVINVTVEDDSPMSGSLDVTLIVPPSNTNLSFIVDVSGSVGNSVNVGGTNIERLELALQGVRDVIQAYTNLGDVRVQIVTFSTSSSSLSTWVTASEALALIGDGSSGSRDAIFTPGGGTNYDVAVAEFQSSYSISGALDSSDPTVNNVSYFISDGAPQTRGGSGNTFGITGAEITSYTNFLVANDIDAFAVGFGGGLDADDQVFLDPLAYNGIDNTDRDGVIVADASTLTSTLLSTIDSTASGNLFGSLDNSFGADGGVTLSITVDGITYSYDPTTNTVTPDNGGSVVMGSSLQLTTSNSGTLDFDFTTGNYTYTANPNLALNTAAQETIDFVSRDNDGDLASGTVNLNVIRGLDSDNDGVLNVNDIDDDNDGILDTVENASLVDTPFTATAANANIAANGSSTSTQTVNLSSFGVAIGSTVTISNVFARGDINGDFGSEFFNLTFVNSNGSGANTSFTGLQTPLNGGVEDAIFRAVTTPVNATVTVVDIGGGMPGFVVQGLTSSDVDNLGGVNGVDYRFDIAGTGMTNDADGDGIINSLDVDSDNDGILDNVEAQAISSSYVAPSGIDANNDGLDDVYGAAGVTPVDTNSDGAPDFVSTDSDGDGILDGLAAATSGNDRLVGGDTTGDTLDGLAGDDQLFGLGGNDSLLGGAGIDFVYGGQGDDTLAGGTESDTFVWRAGDQGTTSAPANDTITDFTVGTGGDALNLADLLQGEASGDLTDYLHFQQDGSGGTLITVDVDGTGTDGVTQNITLTGVDLTAGGSLSDQAIVDSLLAQGNLIVD